MTTWLYRATSAKGSEADTVRFAIEGHVISRPARTCKGALIPNVKSLAVGDRLLLAYRRESALRIRAIARRSSTSSTIPRRLGNSATRVSLCPPLTMAEKSPT